jgi:hypothetical protein
LDDAPARNPERAGENSRVMDPLLQSRLQSVVLRRRWQALGWQFAACWSVAALAGLACLLAQRELGWPAARTPVVLAALAVAAATALFLRAWAEPPDYRSVANQIEARHPELNGLLLTAVQQEVPEGASPNYFQRRLLDQALEHSGDRDWRGVVPAPRLWLAQAVQLAALGLLLATLSSLREGSRPGGAGWAPPWGVAVTPGDASIERGESLVVLARFGGAVPPGVTLVVRASGAVPQRIALVKSLADPVFGASIPEVDADLTYRLEYAGRHTRDYRVSVFEHPRLERADAVLTYPGYTRLAPKRIEDTQRVSAVEGTRLDLALQLNEPVASAALVAHDAKKTVVPLQVAADRAVASLPRFSLVASQTYDLRLVDRAGRTNRPSLPFVIDVLPDRPPELHLATPRGDVRVSAVEEVEFTGTVRGDFGVSAYGLTYARAGGETREVALGRSVPGAEKQPFDYNLALEDLGVRPDQLISWYLWADDTGPDGRPRRTRGELYFAEIRPFDEIFRESKGMPGEGEGAQGGPSQKLAELQKQIITATWKLQRDPSDPKYADDAGVVRDSQDQALTQGSAGEQAAEDPRTKAYWSAATTSMKAALQALRAAPKAPSALEPALAAEQSAYQALLRLQARQTLVGRGRRGGGGGGGSANQEEINQLDLTQDPNHYETQRDASAAETPQRREQLQVMNRLQELARRQQEVNDRLQELQTALQEAKTEQAREDARQRLKRLQDEQQQMLADVDELRQRMDRLENQSAMSGQRQQLDQTRNDVRQAADAAGQGSVTQALASGTRAQRQLQDMHDQLHRENSSQFADDLRELRAGARSLAEQEEAVGEKLGAAGAGERKRLSDAPGGDSPAAALDQQKERMAALVKQAKAVSEQAETSEPLLAEKLYDSLRKLTQDDAGTVKEFQQKLLNDGLLTQGLNDRLNDPDAAEGTKSLDLTAALLREGYQAQAAEAEQRARAGINELKDGLERAAESVIGDDAAALRLARSELDSVTDDLKREGMPSPQGGSPAAPAGAPRPGGEPNGDNPGSPGPGGAPGASAAAGGSAGSAGGFSLDGLFGGNGGAAGSGGGGRSATAAGPLTGGNYGAWSDRLRDVEEIVDSADLRNAVAEARERARLLRQDYTRHLKKPDWAVIQREVTQPLIEVRNRISDELARRGNKDSLVPIDRDPVPNRYAESVRKYYESLGRDQ